MPDDKPDLSAVAEALGGGARSPEAQVASKFESDRAAFDVLEKKYGDGDQDDEPKAEKPKAKARKKKKEQPEEAESQEDAPKVEVREAVVSPELKKAREVLRLRASVPAAVIERLSEEEALEWAASSSKSASEIDRAFMERADLQKELRELKEAASQGEPSSAVPAPGPLDLEAVRSQLSEQFGEEEAAALTGVMKPLHERISQLESLVESAKENNANHISQSNRERLSQFIPLLAESDRAWESVEREVIALAEKDPSAFKDAAGFFDDALKALYGDDALDATVDDEEDLEPEEQEDEDEGRREREKATPLTKSKKPSPRKLPPKESDWQVFKHLDVHPGDIRGARRKGRVKTTA